MLKADEVWPEGKEYLPPEGRRRSKARLRMMVTAPLSAYDRMRSAPRVRTPSSSPRDPATKVAVAPPPITQPLPHVGSWYAHHLPEWLLQAGTVLVLFSELVVPFFIFLPRRFRIFAALLTIVIQSSIIATSNHNFVNLLTILLCLLLLDDRIVRRILPGSIIRKISGEKEPEKLPLFSGLSLIAITLLIFSVSLSSIYRMVGGTVPAQLQQPVQQLANLGPRLGIGNIYHIFPTMQTERQELQIEGSNDGEIWKPYIFRYKPGPLESAPPFIVPHQPRLDWMIWFVPPQSSNMGGWFERLLYRLWQNEPAVTALL